jgi:ComF family protein
VDYLLKELKFHHQLTVARLLGDWLGEMLVHRQTPLPECIIPVPLHPARLRERGFNQALELARPIARRCNIPLVTKAVRRIRHTTPQVQLDLKARRGNVRGAFSANQMVLSRHVAVIDDVITTGNTITEVARVLRSAGVEEIEVWSCARTAQAATS